MKDQNEPEATVEQLIELLSDEARHLEALIVLVERVPACLQEEDQVSMIRLKLERLQKDIRKLRIQQGNPIPWLPAPISRPASGKPIPESGYRSI